MKDCQVIGGLRPRQVNMIANSLKGLAYLIITYFVRVSMTALDSAAFLQPKLPTERYLFGVIECRLHLFLTPTSVLAHHPLDYSTSMTAAKTIGHLINFSKNVL